MSSGEADGYTLRTLDAWPFCRVPGCPWRISNGETCQEHGGRPLGSVKADEWGTDSETYADPELRATWREFEA